MALNAERTAAAKQEATTFLEYSIFVLCTLLGLDPASVNHPYTVPTTDGDPFHDQHVALEKQVAALDAITGA